MILVFLCGGFLLAGGSFGFMAAERFYRKEVARLRDWYWARIDAQRERIDKMLDKIDREWREANERSTGGAGDGAADPAGHL